MPFPNRERHQFFSEASHSFLSFRFRCASVTGYAVHGNTFTSRIGSDPASISPGALWPSCNLLGWLRRERSYVLIE